MFTSIKNTKKGFTLIELLVVIAIIGILSSVVLASLSTARQKSRDAKRVSDLGQVQLALELYFDAQQTYPSTTAAAVSKGGGSDGGIVAVTTAGFLPKTPAIPIPVKTETTYIYKGVTSAGADCTGAVTSCPAYILGTNLERTDNTVLLTDADLAVGTVFLGSYPDCIVNTAGTEQCYDIKP